MEFTFCSQTYNHEEYIIQHLESIKYQVENYGKEITCHYILVDDASADRTVKYVEKWLKKNNNLFVDYKIIPSKQNCGIVKTYTNILRSIKTQYYIILAGDDLCYSNNIFTTFENAKEKSVIITPVIHFMDNRVIDNRYRYMNSIIACGKESNAIKQYLRKQYQYNGRLSAPGIFVTHDLIDDGLYNTLEPYSWIEDAPQFFYHMNQKQAQFIIDYSPKVLYRVDSGVSHHPRSEGYLQDRARLSKEIHTKRDGLPDRISISCYIERTTAALKILNGRIHKNTNKEIILFENTIQEEMKKAQKYLQEINEVARKFDQ